MSFDIAVKKQLGDCAVDVSFQSDDRLVAIIGKSGAGKTTLLNCIAGLIRPDTGHIAIGAETVFDSAEGIDLAPDDRRCGYVFQDSRLFPHISVRDNLRYGERRAKAGGNNLYSFDDAVQLLDIGNLLERKPATLSGGQTKRIAIGRALLSGPRFLLLDEPLASLDPARGEYVLSAIENLRDELQIPTLYVSHGRHEVTRLTGTVITLD